MLDPPENFCRFSFPLQARLEPALAAANGVPSTHIRCKITPSLRASATFAFFIPVRLANFTAQLFKPPPFTGRVRMIWAAFL